MKLSPLRGLSSSSERVEGRLGEENGLTEMMQSEEQRERRMKKNARGLRETWVTVKRSSTPTDGVLGEDRERSRENTCRSNAQKPPQTDKGTLIYISTKLEEFQVGYMPHDPHWTRHNEMLADRDKENILKAARGKPLITYKGNPEDEELPLIRNAGGKKTVGS